jgi:hypothetical protein
VCGICGVIGAVHPPVNRCCSGDSVAARALRPDAVALTV